jgi:hypothetical protein
MNAYVIHRMSPLQKPFLPQRVQRSTKFFETIVRQNSKLLIEPFRNPLYTSCPLWFRPFCNRVIVLLPEKTTDSRFKGIIIHGLMSINQPNVKMATFTSRGEGVALAA